MSKYKAKYEGNGQYKDKEVLIDAESMFFAKQEAISLLKVPPDKIGMLKIEEVENSECEPL